MEKPKVEVEKPKVAKKVNKNSLAYKKKMESKIVEGIFRFYEIPGGSMSFSYKKYKGDDVVNYTMNDGENYKIPLGVANHLRENGWYPEHAHAKTETGHEVRLARKVQRFGFEPVGFNTEDNNVVIDASGRRVVEEAISIGR